MDGDFEVPNGRFITLFSTACLAGMLAACGGVSSAAAESATFALLDERGRDCSSPARVAVVIDKTASGPDYVVVQPTLHDFHTLIGVLRGCGGEIGVGVIRDAAKEPLIPLEVKAEPALPSCAETPPGFQPPMIKASLRDACRRQQRVYASRLAEYNTDIAARTAEFDRRILPILEEPSAAIRTELWRAIAQANTFLNEAADAATTLILISDGIHTTTTARIEPKAAAVYVVNGVGHAGDLGDGPNRFSSVDGAFRAVAGQRSVR